jgi:hypothetical protein
MEMDFSALKEIKKLVDFLNDSNLRQEICKV